MQRPSRNGFGLLLFEGFKHTLYPIGSLRTLLLPQVYFIIDLFIPILQILQLQKQMVVFTFTGFLFSLVTLHIELQFLFVRFVEEFHVLLIDRLFISKLQALEFDFLYVLFLFGQSELRISYLCLDALQPS
jgi:hypothetical protein